MAKPRIVTIDIETAPIQSYHWGIWQQNIGLEQIIEDWCIISFAAKWLDSKEVIQHDTGGRGASKVRDDLGLMKKLWAILDEADIVITQNGKAFDIKKINTRMLMHGLPPYSPVKMIDTKQIAKKHFAFTSNKLAWLSRGLKTKKDDHKKFPGFVLWSECLKDNREAWEEMRKYNIVDVVSTELLYLSLRQWSNGPNFGAYSDSEDRMCPHCGSFNVKLNGHDYTNSGKFQRIKCVSCSGHSRCGSNLLTASKKKSMIK